MHFVNIRDNELFNGIIMDNTTNSLTDSEPEGFLQTIITTRRLIEEENEPFDLVYFRGMSI